MPEIRKRHDRVPADAQHVLEHDARMPRRLQSLRQDHVVEGVVGIVGEVGVGVALDHGETLGDAFVDAFARELDAAPVDAARLQKRSNSPSPQPTSSTRGACSTISATSRRSTRALPGARARIARSVRIAPLRAEPRSCRHAFSPRALPRAVEEAAHDGEQFRLVEQEGVVAFVGHDLGEGDARARRH